MTATTTRRECGDLRDRERADALGGEDGPGDDSDAPRARSAGWSGRRRLGWQRVAGGHEPEPDQRRRTGPAANSVHVWNGSPGPPAPAATRSSPTPAVHGSAAAARKAPACTRRSRHSRPSVSDPYDCQNDGALDRVALGEQDERRQAGSRTGTRRRFPSACPAAVPRSAGRPRQRRPRRDRTDGRQCDQREEAREVVGVHLGASGRDPGPAAEPSGRTIGR